MDIRISWRNLWRNPRRALISISALTAGTIALIFVHALWNGFTVDVVDGVTGLGEGEVKAHAPGYLGDRSIYKTIEDPEALLAAAREHGFDAAPRSIGYGLVARGAKSAGVQIVGADPAAERTLGDLAGHLKEGQFLSAQADRKLVLGIKLAKSIEAKTGDELVIVVQAADGSTSNELYQVGGIFDSVGDSLDRSGIYMHIGDFEPLFAMDGKVHEIAFNSHGRLEPGRVAEILRPAAGTAVISTWRQLYPALASMVEMIIAMIIIVQTFFYMAAALGVMNTMLMATYERIPEFGVMKALGCSPLRIVGEVALEAWLLGMVGCAIGAVIGSSLAIYTGIHGIDVSGLMEQAISVAGIAFDNEWHPVLEAKAVWHAVAVMCGVVILSAVYPAVKAARTDPVKAMSHV